MEEAQPDLTEGIFDVVIVGAGISGIGNAYWLQKKCPEKRIAILEARDQIGGTWSLFQYPGIRSDSDMFTFGYRFKPWTDPQSLSSGDKILKYLEDTVAENKLLKLIHFGNRMVSANWSDEKSSWSMKVVGPAGESTVNTKFLSICTGYYNYKEAYKPSYTNEKAFQGQVVMPQFWPKGLVFREKKIAVIGSGATAMTIVPAMVQQGAGHVTMVQRSPTYVMNLPNRNQLFVWMKQVLPVRWAYRITRVLNIVLSMISFGLSKSFPRWMKKMIMKGAARQLPNGYLVEKHFNPSYGPWDQRLCVVPDGDLFQVISQGKASVVTDEIDWFEENGIRTRSGEKIEADIIVSATGLNIQLLGGADLYVNGKKAKFNESFVYKGMMVSDLPNFIYSFGYTNASWTLKVDLTANYFCKLLQYMDRKSYHVVVPKREEGGTSENFLNLSSGYIARAKNVLPKQGSERPWRVYQSYLLDMLATRFGSVKDKFLVFRAESNVGNSKV